MGQPSPHVSALLILAAFSRHADALSWTRDRAVAGFGPVAIESPLFQFDQTDYYRATMGEGLKKVFFAFEKPYSLDDTVETKLTTNRWEEQYAAEHPHDEPRPLNLDPGYLTLGKLVLSSTKDFAHRIYLARGIYAEVTLFFRHGRWEHHEFTFADYQRADYHVFFTRCRDYLHQRLRRETAP